MILDVLDELLPAEAPTCGAGLAQHATVPRRVAIYLAELAETLELHRVMAVLNDAKALEEAFRRIDVLVRVHSECLTGDVFGSMRCDCGLQLDAAMALIAEEGTGIVIYLRGHEGRGIGLGHKLQAYALQEQGHDTVDANLALGMPVDTREYAIVAQILVDPGIERFELDELADDVERLGIPAAGDVISSAAAAARLVEPGERALVGGGPGIVEALTARNNVAALAAQARGVNPRIAGIAEDGQLGAWREALAGTNIACAAGEAALIEAAERPADWVMAAIVGAAGLRPTLAAGRRGTPRALPHKGSLGFARTGMLDPVQRSCATLLPVDSEHNAVFQCFDRERSVPGGQSSRPPMTSAAWRSLVVGSWIVKNTSSRSSNATTAGS